MYVFLLGVLPFALGAYVFYNTSRAVAETPAYKVIRTDKKFEIRDYPALTVATTPIGGGRQGKSAGFSTLFHFITGSNERAEKINMTTPVLIGTSQDKRTMNFIMPKTAVEKGVPKAVGENVTLGEVSAARYAVLSFSGSHKTKNEKAAIDKLKEWMDTQKLTGLGDPLIAYYDPPWMPVFLRRNEVLIRIGDAQR